MLLPVQAMVGFKVNLIGHKIETKKIFGNGKG